VRLDSAESLVRIRTQHVNDTTRLTQATLQLLLNKQHRELRTYLQQWAPSLYLHTTGNLVLATGDTIALTSATAPFERVWRRDRPPPRGRGGRDVPGALPLDPQ